MDADEKQTRVQSFRTVADLYAQHRPDYPAEAVRWLVGERPVRVLELGAGTGKLTARLCELGHDVVATDPLAEMLAHIDAVAPGARKVLSTAEAIPLASSSVDVVVAASAAHWFDDAHAMPEIARVLKPGGTVAVTGTLGDVKIPWVKKVYALIDHADPSDPSEPFESRDAHDPFEGTDVIELADETVVRHWQPFRKDNLVGFILSQSKIALLDPAEREQRIMAAEDLYDSYGRGPDGLLMPWLTRCWRGRVAGLAAPADHEPTQQISDPDLDDGLLIDFR